ncbi:MAG: hypothetical protein PWQ08_101 [Clostridiales bacterium]|jgi:hypothetical protein|nr:hypothetical protein [Clostridiales bacterium]
MKALLQKELRLAMHPAALLFLGLSALLIIPNYPYYVTFFYTTLGIFFICLTGRETQDVLYSALLPVAKKDIVTARVLVAVGLQLLQMVIAVPFAVLRQRLIPTGNEVGMDANIALFGISLMMLGVFNWVFFTRYYHNVQKVGMPFNIACAVYFVLLCVAEAAAHIVPFVRDKLDTPDPQYLAEKLVVLAVGAVLYTLFTLAACRRAQSLFKKQDL